MKKIVFLVVLLCVFGFIVACPPPGDGNPTPTPTPTKTPTPTPTVTPTPTPTPTASHNVKISAALQRVENLGVYAVGYGVSVFVDGTPCTTATVTLNRPNGQVNIPHTGNGAYLWTSVNAADYQPGEMYTVTVNVNGTNYTDSTTARGNITIGIAQATWSFDGNYDMITIIGNNAYIFTDGPDIDSPYHYPALTPKVQYSVAVTVADIETGGFSGATADSTLSTLDSKLNIIVP